MSDLHEVVLLDFYPSMFGMRVRIALSEKRIEYESKEQNLSDKSPLLLQMNPIYKKVPVLIHNGKPVCDSTIILQYIDEVWKDESPLLPSDSYERAQARFWIDYIDKKVSAAGRGIWSTKGDQHEASKKELTEAMTQLEQTLGDSPYFGGETFGMVDIALICFSTWFYAYEKFGDLKFEDFCPKILEWVERCKERESVSKALADPHKVFEFVGRLRKKIVEE